MSSSSASATRIPEYTRGVMSALVYMWDIGFREGDVDLLKPVTDELPPVNDELMAHHETAGEAISNLCRVPFEEVLACAPREAHKAPSTMSIVFRVRLGEVEPPLRSSLAINKVPKGSQGWVVYVPKISVTGVRALNEMVEAEAKAGRPVWRLHLIAGNFTPPGCKAFATCPVPSRHLTRKQAEDLLYPVTGHSYVPSYSLLTEEEVRDITSRYKELPAMKVSEAQAQAWGFLVGNLVRVDYAQQIPPQIWHVYDDKTD